MKSFNLSLLAVPLLLSLTTPSQSETVSIDHSTQRYIGTVSDLDRDKYFVLHSADSGSDPELDNFYKEYNVKNGRYFWGPFSHATSKTGTVGEYPAYQERFDNALRQVQKGLVATEHPRNAIGNNTNVETAASWAADYFKNTVSDERRPEIYEPLNEPFVQSDFVLSDFVQSNIVQSDNGIVEFGHYARTS